MSYSTGLGVNLMSPEYEDCDPPDCGKFYNDPCEGCTYENYAPCSHDPWSDAKADEFDEFIEQWNELCECHRS